MLTRIAEGVYVHESSFLQTNTVVVRGRDGVLVVDPGITRSELACVGSDLRALGQPVVAGFATHPHFDHVLWDAELGDAPRYATARCAADIEALLSNADWQAQVAEVLPQDIADQIPLELFGLLTGLPEGTSAIPWDGQTVRIIEHRAHEKGHAALLVEPAGVLVAGDMLSDILIPFLGLEADDPIGDYLDALDRLEGVAAHVRAVVPGHGSVGDGPAIRARIALDRAYVRGLREHDAQVDARLVPPAQHSEWLPGVDEWQRKQIAEPAARDTLGR